MFMYVCMYHMCAWWLWRSEEGVAFPRIELKDSHKPRCEYLELNLGLLQDQTLSLTSKLPPLPQKETPENPT